MTNAINKLVTNAVGLDDLQKHEALEKAAQTFVGVTFFGQMLKQMRESPFKSDLFEGGRGGAAFNQMYDGMLAERMGRGSGHKLVDAMVRRIEGDRKYNANKAYKASKVQAPTFSKAA
jgi:Rod binding domain-containing protein